MKDSTPTYFDATVSDKENRPWEQRGFFVIEPVAPNANQSFAQERTGKYELRPDGSDPKEGYPERQSSHKDSAVKRPKRQADGEPAKGPSWADNE